MIKVSKIHSIGEALISTIFWYFFTVVLTEVQLVLISFFTSEITTSVSVLIQVVAILAAYYIVLDKRVSITKNVQIKGSLAQALFFTGTILIITYITVTSW